MMLEIEKKEDNFWLHIDTKTGIQVSIYLDVHGPIALKGLLAALGTYKRIEAKP